MEADAVTVYYSRECGSGPAELPLEQQWALGTRGCEWNEKTRRREGSIGRKAGLHFYICICCTVTSSILGAITLDQAFLNVVIKVVWFDWEDKRTCLMSTKHCGKNIETVTIINVLLSGDLLHIVNQNLGHRTACRINLVWMFVKENQRQWHGWNSGPSCTLESAFRSVQLHISTTEKAPFAKRWSYWLRKVECKAVNGNVFQIRLCCEATVLTTLPSCKCR